MGLNPVFSQKVIKLILWTLTLFTLSILVFIVSFILKEGLPRLNLSFLLSSPIDMGREGGIFPTIVGTIYLTGIAIIIAAPLGVGSAIYLNEYTRESWVTKIIRFGADCLAGIPSIIFGLFGFVLFVIQLKW